MVLPCFPCPGHGAGEELMLSVWHLALGLLVALVLPSSW